MAQGMGRTNTATALTVLFKRLPNLELKGSLGQLSFKHDQVVYGLYTLPVATQRSA